MRIICAAPASQLCASTAVQDGGIGGVAEPALLAKTAGNRRLPESVSEEGQPLLFKSKFSSS